MNRNLSTLLSRISINISIDNINTYFNNFFSFLLQNNSNMISYISFHNYFNLCSFLSSKIFKLFSCNKSSDTSISKEQFIEGLRMMYISELSIRSKMVFDMYDYDNDGVINKEDVKLLLSHFHYLSNTSDISSLMNIVDKFFSYQSKENEMTLSSFENTIKHYNSDILFILLFFLNHHSPFTQEEIEYYMLIENQSNLNLHSNRKLSMSSDDSTNAQINLFADVTEDLFKYLNTNYNLNLQYENTPDIDIDSTNDDDLNDLITIEEDFNQLRHKSFAISCYISPQKDHIRPKPKKNFLCFNGPKKLNRSAMNVSHFAKSIDPVEEIQKSPKHKFLFVEQSEDKKLGSDIGIKNSMIQIKPIFSSNGYISFDDQMCNKCKIDIVGKMLFVTMPHSKGGTRKPLMLPINHMYINQVKKKNMNKKIKVKIMKTFIKSKTLKEINTVEMISGLNNFISFKLSFSSFGIAEEFVKEVERITKWKDIKEEYEMGDVIGKGGFAKVKKGIKKQNGKVVAIKVINKFLTSRDITIKGMDDIDYMLFVITEKDVSSMLMNIKEKHDNIVRIRGIYETFKKVYIVMDYIESGCLEELISHHFTSISLETKYSIASQLSSAIEYLHSHHIMHRDIKAGNILIDKHYHIYLIDFGLSSILGQNEETVGCIGTITYSPPEMYKDKPYNASVDIWSMGVVFYYLYYGVMPFSKEKSDMDEVIDNIINKKVKLVISEYEDKDDKKMQRRILKGIKKCLVREPAKRATAEDVAKMYTEI